MWSGIEKGRDLALRERDGQHIKHEKNKKKPEVKRGVVAV
jgi:hypothetical protein